MQVTTMTRSLDLTGQPLGQRLFTFETCCGSKYDLAPGPVSPDPGSLLEGHRECTGPSKSAGLFWLLIPKYVSRHILAHVHSRY